VVFGIEIRGITAEVEVRTTAGSTIMVTPFKSSDGRPGTCGDQGHRRTGSLLRDIDGRVPRHASSNSGPAQGSRFRAFHQSCTPPAAAVFIAIKYG
jgi:hypothetical protein